MKKSAVLLFNSVFFMALFCHAEECCEVKAEPVIQQVQKMASDSLPPSCEIARLQKDDFFKKPWRFSAGEGYENFNARFNEVTNAVNNCNSQVFDICYPNLKNKINNNKLNALFKAWRNNPAYNMRSAEVHCYHRAYLLSQELTNAGYKVQLLQIEEAPVLIATVKNKNGTPDRYYDYSGQHWIVQIETEDNQKIVLDPQFMTQPTDRASYFKNTIGQICNEGEKSKWSADCNYKLHNANYIMPIEVTKQSDITSKCGWTLSESFKADVVSLDKSTIQTSQPIKVKGSPEKITADLIKTAWIRKYDTLKNEIAQLKKLLRYSKSSLGQFQQLGANLTPQQIQEIEAKLKFSEEDLIHFEKRMKELGFR